MNLSQILALVIFTGMFAAIIIGKVHRYIPALVGGLLVIVVIFLAVLRSPATILQVLNLGEFVQVKFWLPAGEHIQSHGINWQTIVFIAGMMVMVESMGETGFFTWLCLQVARLVKYKIIPILITFMFLSGFLAMFIDSITVLLFFTAIVIELSRLMKFDPVPLIIAMIFAANIGGSATMSGDPPNIIIGTGLGFNFVDFVINTGPIAWICMILAAGFFYLSFRRFLKASQEGQSAVHYPEPGRAIKDQFLFKVNIGIFLVIIVALVTHAQSGISVAFIGVAAAVLSLLAAWKKALHILKLIDYRTLLFFIGLFIAVSGLEVTGVLDVLAQSIGQISNGSAIIVLTIILWISAIASAVVDNIPFAATMVPVISNLAVVGGFPLGPMSWALALGTDIGGNATPIGASANVVATAIAEREGHPITWGRYLKHALPATIIVIFACWIWIVVRYH
jgi:Na+/H+ antiporter NhaD/arsenite permease-like protein